MVKTLVAALVFFFSCSVGYSATFKAKANNVNWNNSASWQLTAGVDLDFDFIPDGDDDVIIEGYTMNINTSVSCKSLKLQNNSSDVTLNIQNGGSLNITGDLTLLAKTFGTSINLTVLNNLIVGGTTFLTADDPVMGDINFTIGNKTNPGYVTIKDLQLYRINNGTTRANKIIFKHGEFDILGNISANGTDQTANLLEAQDNANFDKCKKRIFWEGTSTVNSWGKMKMTLQDANGNSDYVFTYSGDKDQVLLNYLTNFTYKDIEIANAGYKTSLGSDLNTPQVIAGTLKVLADCKLSDGGYVVSNKPNGIKINSGGTYQRTNSTSYSMSTLDLSDAASIFEFYVSQDSADVFTVDGTYHIVNFTGTGIKRLVAPFNSANRLIGSINVKEGTFQYGNSNGVANTIPALNLSNEVGQTHTLKVESGATLNFPGNLTALPGAYFDLDVNSNVHYSWNGSQRIWELPASTGLMSYGNLKLSAKGNTGKVINSNDTIDVKNTVSIGGLTTAAPIKKDLTDLTIQSRACLSLLSTADYTGSIDSLGAGNVITYSGSGANKGSIISRRYIQLPDTGFRDYCSPVQNADLYTLQNAGLFMTGLNGATYGPSVYAYVNAYYYDEASSGTLDKGWTAATAMTQKLTMKDGTGKIIRSAWRIFGGGWSQSELTLMDKGQINTGDQVHDLSFNSFSASEGTYNENTSARLKDDGFHLIGNPYPRALNWDAVVADSSASVNHFLPANGGNGKGLLGTIYIYQPNAMGHQLDQSKNYGSYNAITKVAIGLPNKGIISPFQGFFVQAYDRNANPVSYTLTLKETHKAASNTSTFYKSTDTEPHLVKISVSNSTETDNIHFHEFDQASLGMDVALDIRRFHGQMVDEYYGVPETTLGISFMAGDSVMDLLVNAIPNGNESFVLPIHLKDAEAGEHTLTFEGLQEFVNKFACASLYDHLENKWYDLKSVNTIVYNNPGSYDGKRFTLHFQSPTEVKSIDASCSDSQNGLMTVSFESNADRDFTLLKNGEIVSQFTGEYNKIKKQLAPGTYVLVDNNGAEACAVNNAEFVIGSAPEISFGVSTSETTIKVGVPVTFTNHTTGAESFTWTFYDDNSTSTETNASHTFNTAGAKLVKLEAHSENEECSKSKVFEYQAVDASGISTDIENSGEFNVNLANGFLTISPKDQSSYDYYINSIDGKLLAANSSNSGKISVPADVIHGPVIVIIKSGTSTYSRKLFN